MQPPKDGDYQKLLSEVIKKQIVILGPDITLAKARNVPGLTVADDGSITQITGNPAEITQKLIEQFMELSGLIVKKTMEPLLANFPDGVQPQDTSAPIMPNVPSNPVVQQPATPSVPTSETTPSPAPQSPPEPNLNTGDNSQSNPVS